MDRIMRVRPSKSTAALVLAALALFVALGGGAWALKLTRNSVKSKTIKPGAVKTSDLANDAVSAPKLQNNAVNGPKVGDESLTGADIGDNSLGAADLDGVGFLRANTVTLTDAAGGGFVNQTLLTIGRVTMIAGCQNMGGGSVTAQLIPGVQEVGPILVTDGQAGAADDDVALQPADVQFVLLLTSSAVAAREASFGILDDSGTSATGVAAVALNPSIGRCVFSAHAVG